MRNVPLIMITTLALAMVGCDTTREQPGLQIDGAREVLTLHGMEQRLAFGLLNPEERAAAWKIRLDRVQGHEFDRLSKTGQDAKRLALFSEYRSIVTNPANFAEAKTPEVLRHLDSTLVDWDRRARGAFTGKEVYSLLFTLSPDSTILTLTAEMENALGKEEGYCGSGPGANCCCSIGSSMTCPEISLSLDNFGISYGTCWSQGCSGSGTMAGCGAGFFWRCNGGYCTSA